MVGLKARINTAYLAICGGTTGHRSQNVKTQLLEYQCQKRKKYELKKPLNVYAMSRHQNDQ